MILVAGPLDPPAGRLLDELEREGTRVVRDAAGVPAGADVTLAVSTGPPVFDLAALLRRLEGRPLRALVLSRLGAHPDARHPALRRLWHLEEHVRGGGVPSLTLRLAPLLGPATPLWERLRARPALPRGGRPLLNPVSQRDVLATLRRALAGPDGWEGWYEVAGPEPWTLAELCELAEGAGPGAGTGAWEPPLEEMLEHRLAESEPWAARFGLVPERVVDAVRETVA